jgi:hypothetical protein
MALDETSSDLGAPPSRKRANEAVRGAVAIERGQSQAQCLRGAAALPDFVIWYASMR